MLKLLGVCLDFHLWGKKKINQGHIVGSKPISHRGNLKQHAGLFNKSREGLEVSAFLRSSQGMAFSDPDEGLAP